MPLERPDDARERDKARSEREDDSFEIVNESKSMDIKRFMRAMRALGELACVVFEQEQVYAFINANGSEVVRWMITPKPKKSRTSC